jgi:FkbM family methyltransferase
MTSTVLAMRHSVLGRNHLQTLAWLRREGWQVKVIPPGYRLSHPAYGTRPMPLELELRAFPSSDLDVFQQVFVELQYISAVQKMLQHPASCLNPLIIDGGANIGLFSLFISRLFPAVRLLAVEPFAANARQLRNNLALNHIHDVVVFEGALWGSTAALGIDRSSGDRREWAVSVTAERAGNENSGSIEGRTVEQLAASAFPASTIDLLKLDIEGAEFAVLGDPSTEAFIAAQVRVLSMEIHPAFGDAQELLQRYSRYFSLEQHGECWCGTNRHF